MPTLTGQRRRLTGRWARCTGTMAAAVAFAAVALAGPADASQISDTGGADAGGGGIHRASRRDGAAQEHHAVRPETVTGLTVDCAGLSQGYDLRSPGATGAGGRAPRRLPSPAAGGTRGSPAVVG